MRNFAKEHEGLARTGYVDSEVNYGFDLLKILVGICLFLYIVCPSHIYMPQCIIYECNSVSKSVFSLFYCQGLEKKIGSNFYLVFRYGEKELDSGAEFSVITRY